MRRNEVANPIYSTCQATNFDKCPSLQIFDTLWSQGQAWCRIYMLLLASQLFWNEILSQCSAQPLSLWSWHHCHLDLHGEANELDKRCCIRNSTNEKLGLGLAMSIVLLQLFFLYSFVLFHFSRYFSFVQLLGLLPSAASCGYHP